MKPEFLIEGYCNWLNENTVIRDSDQDEWMVFSTPFTGAMNELIEVFVRSEDDVIIFSDDGITLNNLETMGVHFSENPEAKIHLNRIMKNFDIRLRSGEFISECPQSEFNKRMHQFIETLISVNQISMMTRYNKPDNFNLVVEYFLDDLEINYSKEYSAKNAEGRVIEFDFLVEQAEKDLFLKPIDNLNRSTLTSFIHMWYELIEIRKEISDRPVISLAMINDSEGISKDQLKDLAFFDIDYVLWSQRMAKENIHRVNPDIVVEDDEENEEIGEDEILY